ncbi:hypothetical protein B4135_1018 [Caldibacillus debilis]|uniref:Uncharacterized protein n=1 Tax=Caldibacillus debilis TaxID=301148 RepID=A0A150MEA8_9BACI|nr:hypothetical protein B4135_1018 [Caldibacillus debilis]
MRDARSLPAGKRHKKRGAVIFPFFLHYNWNVFFFKIKRSGMIADKESGSNRPAPAALPGRLTVRQREGDGCIL